MFCNRCNHHLPEDSEFCQYCGSKLEFFEEIPPDLKMEKTIKEEGNVISAQNLQIQERAEIIHGAMNTCVSSEKKNSFFKTFLISLSIVSFVISVIGAICVIFAMNLQDVRRNYLERWNPTVVYSILLSVFLVFAIMEIVILKTKKFSMVGWATPSLLIVSLVAVAEGSILSSRGFDTYKLITYEYSNDVDCMNELWFNCVLIIFIINCIPLAVILFRKIRSKWHQSLLYREKCYRKIIKMKTYLETGTISIEEFEMNRQQILKDIEY